MSKFILFSLCLISTYCLSQTFSSLNSGSIIELETIQTSSNTLITCVMERDSILLKDRVILYRSVNGGATWNEIDYGRNDSLSAGDPVICEDLAGNLYLVLMRIHTYPELIVDLELHVSVDDGITWDLESSPHNSGGIADYPQIIAGEEGQLFLVYTSIPVLGEDAFTTFKRSLDRGETWVLEEEWTSEGNSPRGPDLSWTQDNGLLVSFGGVHSNKVYYTNSTDFGDTWTELSTSENTLETDLFNITKPYSHPDFSTLGILSHQPHQEGSPINNHFSLDGGSTFNTSIIGNGAYAESVIDEEGHLHVIYNKRTDDAFQILYRVSTDGGTTFSSPEIAYAGIFEKAMSGEYQSLIYGSDHRFYLTFCDWSDLSKAKILVFTPELLGHSSNKKNNPITFTQTVDNHIKVNFNEIRNVNRIVLMDQQGKIVREQSFDPNSTDTTFLLKDLETGVYLITIHAGNMIYSNRFIK